MQKRISVLKTYLVFALIEGLGAAAALLGAPSEAASAWILGYSRQLAALIFAVLAALLILAALLGLLFRNKEWAAKVAAAIERLLSKSWVYIGGLLIFWLAFWSVAYALILAGQITDNLIRVRLARVAPILMWLALLSLQTVIFLPLLRFGEERGKTKVLKGLFWPVLTALGGFGLIALIMNATGWGLTPDMVGWDNFGAPILGTQVIVAISLALGLWGLGRVALNKATTKSIFVDVAFAVLIWSAAFFLWNAEPQSPTFFSPAPRAPNFVYYPHSDAALHDIAAQNALIGEGFSPIAEKPLYSFFLLIAHLMLGQDYANIITLQAATLAFFPVIAYLLGKTLHHRFTGLLLAGLLIFREQNNIALSSLMRVSHSKLLMTDLPAAMAIALFILLAVYWLSKKREKAHWALLAGGMLGAVLLIRSQAIAFVPIFLVLLFFIFGKASKALQQGIFFALGVAIVILPWMTRNYFVTGVFGYAQPRQAIYLARQYTLTPEADPDTRLGFEESEGVAAGFGQALSFAREHPDIVFRFITSHFLRNEISSLFALPVSFSSIAYNDHEPYVVEVDPFLWHNCCSLTAFVESAPYWPDWDGVLSGESIIPVTANLVLLALGLGVAWKQFGLVGMLPLFLHLAYSLSVAIARISGWRLILPVDWIAIFYYCIGLSQLLLWMLNYLSGGNLKEGVTASLPEEAEVAGEKVAVKKVAGVGLALLLFSASIPVAESLFPQKYGEIATQDALVLIGRVEDLNAGFPSGSFIGEDEILAFEGLALYPRYYPAEEGEPAGNWPNYNPQPFNRLGFQLLGPHYEPVVVPLSAPPDFFPNGSDVVVLGCRTDQYVLALAVILVDYPQQIIWASDIPEETCDAG